MGDLRDLVAVGYEDDSFIVYSILRDFQPMFRGVGHRAFISQIKFDNFYMDEQQRYFKEANRRATDFKPP